MEIFIFWLAFSVIVGVFASQRRNRDGGGWFLLALVISPVLAFLLVAAMKEKAPRVIITTGEKPRAPDNGLVVAFLLGGFAIVALMLVLLGATASQSAELTIPPEYRGKWCDGSVYLVKCNDARNSTYLSATRLLSEHHDCKLTQIKPLILDGVNLPEGIFTCSDGQELKFTITTGSGSMGHKSRRLYLGDDR